VDLALGTKYPVEFFILVLVVRISTLASHREEITYIYSFSLIAS
jgi:hypothetical protein